MARPFAHAFDTTSAGGAMLLMRQVREPILASVIFVGLGTSAAVLPPPEEISHLQRPIDQTNAGTSAAGSLSDRGAIAELRRLSGLTWDQLARLFNVSRRALHFWASGKPMTPATRSIFSGSLLSSEKLTGGRPALTAACCWLLGKTEAFRLTYWPSAPTTRH